MQIGKVVDSIDCVVVSVPSGQDMGEGSFINVTDHRPEDVVKWSPCRRMTSLLEDSEDTGIRNGNSPALEGRIQLPLSISWKTAKATWILWSSGNQ